MGKIQNPVQPSGWPTKIHHPTALYFQPSGIMLESIASQDELVLSIRHVIHSSENTNTTLIEMSGLRT